MQKAGVTPALKLSIGQAGSKNYALSFGVRT